MGLLGSVTPNGLSERLFHHLRLGMARFGLSVGKVMRNQGTWRRLYDYYLWFRKTQKIPNGATEFEYDQARVYY